jgi:tetratricopeptide (TPR) repeat protein
MKTLFITFALFLAVDKYTDQMSKNIELVYKAATIEELQKAVNAFERIGGAEKTKWEPYYYASFGYIMMAIKETDGTKKDGYLDLAKSVLDKATAIKADESEIVTLEGFIHTIRASVDPASRGQQSSTLAMQAYGKAIALNPQNPRALAMMAQLQFGTAQFFKQAPIQACETARKAIALFDVTPKDNGLAPAWGRGTTEELVKGCN